jgi:hypothetical protein
MAVDAEHAALLAQPVAVEVQVDILKVEVFKVEILRLAIPIVAATIGMRMIACPVAVTEAAG